MTHIALFTESPYFKVPNEDIYRVVNIRNRAAWPVNLVGYIR